MHTFYYLVLRGQETYRTGGGNVVRYSLWHNPYHKPGQIQCCQLLLQATVHPKFLSEGDFHITTFIQPRADIAVVVCIAVRHSGSCCGGRELLRCSGSGLRWWHEAGPRSHLTFLISSKLSTDRPRTFSFVHQLFCILLSSISSNCSGFTPSKTVHPVCVSLVDAKKLENFRSLHLYCRKFWFPIEAS